MKGLAHHFKILVTLKHQGAGTCGRRLGTLILRDNSLLAG